MRIRQYGIESLNGRFTLLAPDPCMSTQGTYDTTALWQILAETVHALPMYKYHKRYVERSILPEKPQISAKEMALLMGMPLGEGIVILEELRPMPKSEQEPTSRTRTAAAKSLLDYTIA